MRFIGKIWRLLVGVKDGLVLILVLIFFGSLYAALSAAPTVGPNERGALLLDLAGSIVEQPAAVDAIEVLGGGSSLAREYRLRDLVHSLNAAAKDDRIKAVALDLDSFAGGGQVALSHVGEAIDTVRRANKPVIAYASGYTDDSYQLAAHASEVWLNPLGAVLIRGPGGNGLYFKGLLDKLGVSANVYKAGTYKAATEPFTRNDMSPEARAAMQALAGSLWENWLAETGRARPKAKLASYIATPDTLFARADGDMAKAAQAAGLVDRLGDRTAFGNRLGEIVGVDDTDVPGSFETIRFDAWNRANPLGDMGGSIGVVTVAGEIVDGDVGDGMAGGATIARLIHDGLGEQDLKALVVRVDSPGGSVLASEQIRQAILDAKGKGIPIIVSMGSVAASGGYWIATAADHVMAEPSTITGSIGVFGILPSFEGALQKLGLGADGVKTTPLSGEPDLLRGPSPEADRLIQMSVDNIYSRFLAIVSAARKLPVGKVDAIAQGRVWDGGTARQLGLVDSFGSLEDAIAEAARRAKLDPDSARPVFLDREPSFEDSLLAMLAEDEEQDAGANDMFSRIAAEPGLLMLQAFSDAQRMLAGSAIQARCLECPPVSAPRLQKQRRSRLATLFALLMP